MKPFRKGLQKPVENNEPFEEFYKCVYGKEHKKGSENYVISSFIYALYMQNITKNSSSDSDDKRFHLKNVESKPWD